jgi:hypothetical protein
MAATIDRIYLEFEEDNLELWRHVVVWLDHPNQLCWKCKYCGNVYEELFSTDMIYRHLLSTESGINRDFNCQKVNLFALKAHYFNVCLSITILLL